MYRSGINNSQRVHFFKIWENMYWPPRPAPPRPAPPRDATPYRAPPHPALEKCKGWELIHLSQYFFSNFGEMCTGRPCPSRPTLPRPAPPRKLGKMYWLAINKSQLYIFSSIGTICPLCDIPPGCCFFTGPWTVTRSSLRMLRQVAAFCRPLQPVLLLVSFPRSWSPVVGVPGPCWMWHGVPFARQWRPVAGLLRLCWLVPGSFDCFCCPRASVHRPSITCLAMFPCV